MSQEMALAQALRRHPHTVFPTRLQQNRCLGAWRAGQLIGAIDVAVGFDSDTLDQPDYSPIGLLRFLMLPARSELVSEAASALLNHAEEFWRSAGVGHVKAFHISTGYPAFQAGAGLLPGDWDEHVRVLTEQGYQFANRYYAVHRLLSDPVEEYLALAELGLVFRGTVDDRRYTVYRRRTEQIASARLVRAEVERDGVEQVVGLIPALYVDPHWRQRDLGKWLLSRMINDGLLQKYHELVAYISMEQNAAMNLLMQWGFEELHYRGYVLEKALTS
jgi:GNAT superfamily N-acetyltransferase